MKTMSVCALLCALLMACSACDRDKTAKDNNAARTPSTTAQTQTAAKGGQAWPVNQYTNLVPKPEGVIITESRAIDNPSFAGCEIMLKGWSIADSKAYATKLQQAGFNRAEAGHSTLITKDTADSFSFGAVNGNGVFVGVHNSSTTGNGGIIIQAKKN